MAIPLAGPPKISGICLEPGKIFIPFTPWRIGTGLFFPVRGHGHHGDLRLLRAQVGEPGQKRRLDLRAGHPGSRHGRPGHRPGTAEGRQRFCGRAPGCGLRKPAEALRADSGDSVSGNSGEACPGSAGM